VTSGIEKMNWLMRMMPDEDDAWMRMMHG